MTELHSVPSVRARSAPRWNVYSSLHKASCRVLCDTLALVGATDADDAHEVAQALDQTGDMLSFMELALDLDARQLQPMLPAIPPEMGAALTVRRQGIARLRQACRAPDLADAAARGAARARGDAELACFVAGSMQAMLDQEARANMPLWETYSDTQLRALETSTLCSVDAGRAALWLQWMIPALDPPARLRALDGLRSRMPDTQFRRMMLMLEDVLPHAAHHALLCRFPSRAA